MSSLNKSSFLKIFLSYLPFIMLFFSVFNKFDFNYLKLDYFAFNFVHLLIFFWTLRNPDQLGYSLFSNSLHKKHYFNSKLYEGLDIIIIHNFINKFNSSNYFGFSLFN